MLVGTPTCLQSQHEGHSHAKRSTALPSLDNPCPTAQPINEEGLARGEVVKNCWRVRGLNNKHNSRAPDRLRDYYHIRPSRPRDLNYPRPFLLCWLACGYRHYTCTFPSCMLAHLHGGRRGAHSGPGRGTLRDVASGS